MGVCDGEGIHKYVYMCINMCMYIYIYVYMHLFVSIVWWDEVMGMREHVQLCFALVYSLRSE